VTVDLHAAVEGPADGPVLVLLSSLGTTGAMWQPQAVALRDTYRVVRADHRGHGGSPVPPGPYELADLGTDVLALLDRLRVRRASLAGLSLGGMVAMWLAIHHPDRLHRLVLCSTAAVLGPPQNWADRAALVRAEGTAALAATVVGRWLTPAYASAHPGLVEWLEAMVAGTSAAGYAACCGVVERMDLVPELPSIVAPTLVIAGADDPATPIEHAERIAAGIPGARLEVLSPGAHLVNLEQPDAVTTLLRSHLPPVSR
jgi:3-oxoadipate enol-lactonase